jgi:hypothetical protein
MTKMRAVFVAVCALMLLLMAGCVTGEKVRADLRTGMTRQEVISAIGNPEGVRTSGDSEVLQYTNRLISGWSWDRADYFVVLKAGVVAEYGTGEVRQAPAAQGGFFFIVPVR